MKKTLSINIGSKVFNIDNDAYELLKKYLDSIKSYFEKIKTEEDILVDIETRISEKFSSIEIKTTFQSRFGPQKWLQPYTDKTLESLPSEGKKNVLAICPGFASDCVETLEEILIQGKESFLDSGGENFDMVPCLNDNDDHILLLKSLIERNI